MFGVNFRTYFYWLYIFKHLDFYTNKRVPNGDLSEAKGPLLSVTITYIMNDIVKFCDKKKCDRSVLYNKLATAGNNPNISSKMKCSQQIQNYSRSRSTLDPNSDRCKIINYNIRNGISNCPPSNLATPSGFRCSNPIFSDTLTYPSSNVSKCKCNL